MEKLVTQIQALGEAIKALTPTTVQQQSALNGVSHVMDNVKGHFDAVAAIAAKAAAAPPNPEVVKLQQLKASLDSGIAAAAAAVK